MTQKNRSSNSNTGRNVNAWHPIWLWELLRRNQLYKRAVEEFKSSITPPDIFFKGASALAGLAKNNEALDYIQKNRHKMYQIFESISELEGINIDNKGKVNIVGLETSYKNFSVEDTSEKNQRIEVEKNQTKKLLMQYRGWNEQTAESLLGVFLYDSSEKEDQALNTFLEKFGWLISFPLKPEKDPHLEVISHVIHARPARIAEDVSPKHPLEQNINLLINTAFPLARIAEDIKGLIEQKILSGKMSTIFSASSKKWDDLRVQLRCYDLIKIDGAKPTEASKIIEKEFGERFSNPSKSTNDYANSIEKLIDLLNPDTSSITKPK